MKMHNLRGLLALIPLCFLSAPLAAQSPYDSSADTKTIEVVSIPAAFEYYDITLSDPAIYSNEDFSISLTVENTGGKEAKHEILLLLKDETAPKGLRKQASKFVALRAGQSETVTFTFKAADLVEALESMPEVFVFLLGEYEIGIGFEK